MSAPAKTTVLFRAAILKQNCVLPSQEGSACWIKCAAMSLVSKFLYYDCMYEFCFPLALGRLYDIEALQEDIEILPRNVS